MLSMNYANLSDNEKQSILKKEYTKNKKSFLDIATLYNTYPNKIRRDLKKFNIPIRNKSEAQKNALNTGKHKHPTKGQKRNDATKHKIGFGVMKSWETLSSDELDKRKQKSRENWENLDTETKENILKSANNGARLSSKLGSKLEKYLLNRLLKDGYVVEFHKEQFLLNTKLQIDLFLPMLNIAIEVDGPSHFSPIWGEDTLEKNQKYDKKKTGLITGKGIGLIRIIQTRDFSNARAELIYSSLREVLSNSLNTNNSKLSIELRDDS